MKLIVAIVVGLTVSSVVVPEQAVACTCAAPATPAEGFERSIVVFLSFRFMGWVLAR